MGQGRSAHRREDRVDVGCVVGLGGHDRLGAVGDAQAGGAQRLETGIADNSFMEIKSGVAKDEEVVELLGKGLGTVVRRKGGKSIVKIRFVETQPKNFSTL